MRAIESSANEWRAKSSAPSSSSRRRRSSTGIRVYAGSLTGGSVPSLLTDGRQWGTVLSTDGQQSGREAADERGIGTMEGSRGQAPPAESRIERLEREVAQLT